MSVLNKEQIIKYLEDIEENGEPITEEAKEKYKDILEYISKTPSLQAFLDKKAAELMIKYIGDNKEIITEPKKLVKNENGFVELDRGQFLERDHNGSGTFALKWIIAKGTQYLIKELDSDNDITTTLISEQIARSSGYNVATYYPAILNGKEVIITPSFLNVQKDEDENDYFEEKIIDGKKISGYNMDISENPDLIRQYFSKRGVTEDKIQELVENYKSVMLYNNFINLKDGHNGNWGVIVGKDNQYKFTPIYDLEGGLYENPLMIRATYIDCEMNDEDDVKKINETMNKKMFEYLLEDENIRKYAENLLNINMNEVFEIVEKSKKVKIPEEIREKTCSVINKNKSVISEILDKYKSLEIDDAR